MAVGVFPQRMDRVDPGDPAEAIRTMEDYIRYMTERVEFSVTNHARNLRKQGVGMEEIAAAVTEQGDKVANLSAQLAVVGAAVNTMAAAVEDLDLRVRVLEATGIYPIEAVQEGSGDPSPDNVRPIRPGLRLVRDDDSVLEVYGGELDTTSGVLTATYDCVDLGDFDWTINTGYTNPLFRKSIPGWKTGSINNGFSSNYAPTTDPFNRMPDMHWTTAATNNTLSIRDSRCETVAEFKAAVTDAKFVFELAEPVTYQLTEAEVRRALRDLV